MKWFVVILFADWVEYPIYVFTDTSFTSREECVENVMNPENAVTYLNHLFLTFGSPMPIQAVNCIDETILNQLIHHDTI